MNFCIKDDDYERIQALTGNNFCYVGSMHHTDFNPSKADSFLI